MAARALEFARVRMTGLCKDGITPEFHHPLAVTRLIRTLPPLISPEETLAAGFLHDLLEDDPNVTLKILQKNFGELVADAVWHLSKKQNGLVKTPDSYYELLSRNAIASIVKGADRCHNLYTMWGVFSPEKQLAYLIEARDRLIPMLKSASYNFPDQWRAYENLQINLKV